MDKDRSPFLILVIKIASHSVHSSWLQGQYTQGMSVIVSIFAYKCSYKGTWLTPLVAIRIRVHIEWLIYNVLIRAVWLSVFMVYGTIWYGHAIIYQNQIVVPGNQPFSHGQYKSGADISVWYKKAFFTMYDSQTMPYLHQVLINLRWL